MRVRLALAVFFLTANAFAVAPQFWRTRAVDDFLGGDIEGFAVTSRGELRAGPGLRKIASFTDPFVLAQTAAPNGDRFFGTGNDGKIYRLRGTEMKLLYTAPEPEVYALAFRDGSLYAGTSPNGKVYRINPEDGKSSVFYDPQQAYIWALEFLDGGDLAVGTGVEGKLFRVTAAGQGKVMFDAPETHIRSLAARRDGTLLAGGSGQGRIYEIRPDGTAHALYDSALNEISALYVDASGTGWAAGVSNVLPASAPVKTTKPAQQPSGATTSPSSADTRKEGETPANVEVTFSFDSSTTGSAPSGTSELYRIHPDGFVEVARKFDREMIYALSGGTNGSLMLSTGPQGRIYSFKDGEIALVATAPEKQVVSISSEGGATLVTTTNSGAVYRLDNAPSTRAEFRSQAKDVERFSKFGHYQIDGSNLDEGRVAIAFRSGNTRTPDSTWSNWSMPVSAPSGNVSVPAARYIQWKLTMPKPGANVAVDAVTVGFINRNVAPVIDGVMVQDPAVVFISSSYPASPQVVEATNPDEYGIFTSLDTPREKDQQGKKVFRKGFRTITWRAHDDNGDNLRYSLAFRPRGTEKWLRLRDNLDEMQMNFDTSQFPDGVYELRLLATDALDNPDQPLTDVKDAIEFQVDNTAPVITSKIDGDEVAVRITDKIGTVGRVEYSADAQRWTRLTPTDGIADSGDETYKLKRSDVQGKFVIVRAVDSFYNVATESITLP